MKVDCKQSFRITSALNLLTVACLGVAGSSLIPGQALAYSIPTQGLVALWSGDGNANDSTGAHNGTTPFGMNYVPGVVGLAFSQGDGHQKVTLPDSPAFQLTSALTIEGWIYPTGPSQLIFWRGDDRPGLDPYFLDARTAGQIGFTIDDLTSSYTRLTAPIQYNQWQHIAATWDHSTGLMDLYVNGALASQVSTTVVPAAALDPAYNPSIGILNIGGTQNFFPFAGSIDELGLYSRALTGAEIAAIYNSVPEPSIAALVGLGLVSGLISRRNRRGNR